jgi:hypothetical protein
MEMIGEYWRGELAGAPVHCQQKYNNHSRTTTTPYNHANANSKDTISCDLGPMKEVLQPPSTNSTATFGVLCQVEGSIVAINDTIFCLQWNSAFARFLILNFATRQMRYQDRFGLCVTFYLYDAHQNTQTWKLSKNNNFRQQTDEQKYQTPAH